MEQHRINFLKTIVNDGIEYYIDPVREKPVVATPEEKVRQTTLEHLITALRVPVDMIVVEGRLSHYGINTDDRADIVIEAVSPKDKMREPIAVIECKAPEITLGDEAHTQMVGYADRLNTMYCMLTNGKEQLFYFYDEDNQRYVEIKAFPSYEDMLRGEYIEETRGETKPRMSLEKLIENPHTYVEIGQNTPDMLASFCENLWECLLYPDSKIRCRKAGAFEIAEDAGVRILRFGNASGSSLDGAYRSVYIKYKGKIKLVSIGISPYSTYSKPDVQKTALCVGIEEPGKRPHHALELVMDDNAEVSESRLKIYHNGRIAVGKIGSGKINDLFLFVKERAPYLCYSEEGKQRFYMGDLHFDKLWQLDDLEIEKLLDRIITYSLLRDDFREKVKQDTQRFV